MQVALQNFPLKNTAISRGTFLRWLRKTHGWIGLWGAMLGLLFGSTGFLLNHRAAMKISAAEYEKSEIELALPQPVPANAEALGAWLQSKLVIKQAPLKVASEPAKQVTWAGKQVEQPAFWKVDFHNPKQSFTAEYWVGNSFVTVKRQDANVFAFLTRLHKGVGLGAGWILLADSLAGSLILLSITGVLLWTKMRGSRLTMACLMGLSSLLAVYFALSAI